jgi:hypothetical protein
VTSRSSKEVEAMAQTLEDHGGERNEGLAYQAAAALRELARQREALGVRVKQLELGYDELRTVNNRLLLLRAAHERLRAAARWRVEHPTSELSHNALLDALDAPTCPLAPGAGTGDKHE